MLYNSLSNSFAELTPDLYSSLKKCYQGSPMPFDVDDITYKNLVRMKALVESDETERLRIKYKVQQSRFSPSRLLLTICPTLGCNFRCGYCFEHDHPNINMSDDTANAIVEFVKRHPDAKMIGVTWFGGEPLMQFNRIVSLTEKMIALGKKYGASIITNGYLMDKVKLTRFKGLKIGRVQITLDGLQSTHDRRRFLKGGGGTYNRILDNIAMAAELAPDVIVSVRVNIDGDNADDYIAFHEFIRQQGWKNVQVSPAFVGDYREGHCGYMLEPSVRRRLLEKYSETTGQFFSQFYPSGGRGECAIRNPNAYVIGPEGEIYKCWNDVANPKRVVAHVNGKVVNEDLLLRYISGSDPLESPECNECLLFPVCSGGCPYERMRQTSTGDLCPLFKTNLNDFLWKKYINMCHA